MQTEEKPPTYKPKPPTHFIPFQSRTTSVTIFIHPRDERKAGCYAPCHHRAGSLLHEIGLGSVFVTLLVAVLSRVGTFVVPELDESIITRCQEGTEEGPEPVDPMVVWEVPVDDTGPEGSGWVE